MLKEIRDVIPGDTVLFSSIDGIRKNLPIPSDHPSDRFFVFDILLEDKKFFIQVSHDTKIGPFKGNESISVVDTQSNFDPSKVSLENIDAIKMSYKQKGQIFDLFRSYLSEHLTFSGIWFQSTNSTNGNHLILDGDMKTCWHFNQFPGRKNSHITSFTSGNTLFSIEQISSYPYPSDTDFGCLEQYFDYFNVTYRDLKTILVDAKQEFIDLPDYDDSKSIYKFIRYDIDTLYSHLQQMSYLQEPELENKMRFM